MSLATLTDSGRAALVELMLSQPLHVGWGSGYPAWSEDPEKKHLEEPLYNKTRLENELGRRAVGSFFFVTPDPNGSIIIPVNELEKPEEGLPEEGYPENEVERYSKSDEPTPFLHMEVKFEFSDARGQVIRELGLFLGTKLKEGVPPGQTYLTPQDLESPGRLLSVQRFVKPLQRVGTDRQAYEFIFVL